MARMVVFGGAPDADTDGILPRLKKDDLIACADSGLLYAQQLGLTPDLIVGDFDSFRGSLPENVRTIMLPVEKDDTDVLAVLREGLACGYREFLLLCCVGGRLDHTLANLFLLGFLRDHGAKGEIVFGQNSVILLENETFVLPEEKNGQTFSIFAFGGDAQGVTLSGVKYPLRNATVTTDFPVGISNRAEQIPATVSVKAGRLLLVY